MRHVVSAALIIVGFIHLMPVAGLLGGERLASLYGISVDDPSLVILMRHRAVLFGLLGLFLVFAAFRPAYQAAALIAAFVSVASFLWLAWSTGSYNAQVGRVITADVIALACLVAGAAAFIYLQVNRH